ncbi:hypothetical protein L873DRAFT_1794290 [Choiromyces venosus 120613-1]|uniref:AB hydrolase-1 domain-containing protein n=1 Tax=Choiromyces venosus 120613-1 TaxID=1336337 RepID=A0A3N4J217_9PEZI|nr:hypothetical protein L873DRAFT_1794290 [Choiromyces venosus 120613-1]
MDPWNNPIAELPGSDIPPPLPPREPIIPPPPPPPSYSLMPSTENSYSYPRSEGNYNPPMQTSSTSKPLSDSIPCGKRKLLLIYIHGFMGNETSFQSFPAHLHNLLSVTLEDLGWGVHTKVYPKFKTRNNISVATEGFSRWLAQFENPGTDVILLGHSMGGILAAEVVLLRDERGGLRHRILGAVAFDSPFLGMHPGVISAGLGSLFRSEGKSTSEEGGGGEGSGVYAGENPSMASLSTVHSGGTVDEFFDKRPERNFTVLKSKQEGTLNSALKFINKHHSRLTAATGQYLMSHLEFGGCLADPSGLKNRYHALRKLETGEQTPDGKTIRVRFGNYYTSSTGRSKEPPKPAPAAAHPEHSFDLADAGVEGSGGSELQEMTREMHLGVNPTPPRAHARNLSASTTSSGGEMTVLDPHPVSDNEAFYDTQDQPRGSTPVPIIETTVVDTEPPMPDHAPPSIPTHSTTSSPAPPGISPPPPKPAEFDYSQIPDATVRKAAEKAAAKAMKLWEQNVKEYEKTIKNRGKALEKAERKKREKAEKEKKSVTHTQNDGEIERLRLEKERMEREERRLKGIPEPLSVSGDAGGSTSLSPQSSNTSSSTSPSPTPSAHSLLSTPAQEQPRKKHRERKFCLTPRTPDACWIKVEMTGVDEVGAHCGLFFLGDVYERLVGDVAGRIEGWIGEEGTRRLLEGEDEVGGKIDDPIPFRNISKDSFLKGYSIPQSAFYLIYAGTLHPV